MRLPVAVARLLKSYDRRKLRWRDPVHRWAIVSEVLVRGDAEARLWLDQKLTRDQQRAMLKEFHGAGISEPDRVELRQEFGLSTDDLPVRPMIGYGWSARRGPLRPPAEGDTQPVHQLPERRRSARR